MAVFSIALFSNDPDRYDDAVSFLAAAYAQNKTPILFLRGPALRAFVTGEWKENETLTNLREKGKLRLYACSAWVKLNKLEPADVAPHVDAIVGLNAFLSQAEGGPILYI